MHISNLTVLTEFRARCTKEIPGAKISRVRISKNNCSLWEYDNDII